MSLDISMPIEPQDNIWDVVVIGTGAGGATAGFNLARLGRSVLFLERGEVFEGTGAITKKASLCYPAGSVRSPCAPYNAHATENGPILVAGLGIGGTTSVFSMVMDRFRPIDFEAQRFVKIPPSSSLPGEWPIEYADLEPHYRQAESLFRVRGTDDPLTSTRSQLLEPLIPSDTEATICDTLAQSALHPYRLHYAREQVVGCEGCALERCTRQCRNDAARMCVIPALERHGAQILPGCVVTKLETSGRSVRQAICLWNGRRVSIRGRIFILALNALFTPALLLRSANDLFPEGLGNRSGMVGRNLMLHVSDVLSVKFKGLHGLLNATLHNGLSLNDFYVLDGFKLGNIHAHALNLAQLAKGFPASKATDAGTALFSTIVEDFPYIENRVTPQPNSDGDVFWEYKYPEELSFRSKMLVKAFTESLEGRCEVSVREPSGVLNPSHMCGTCRFGNDPTTSVLDRDNRIHDIDNTYIVDGSFFPSSGGINPSLTIVANSLRVSSLIARR